MLNVISSQVRKQKTNVRCNKSGKNIAAVLGTAVPGGRDGGFSNTVFHCSSIARFRQLAVPLNWNYFTLRLTG